MVLTDPFNLYQSWPGHEFFERLLLSGDAGQDRRKAWYHITRHGELLRLYGSLCVDGAR